MVFSKKWLKNDPKFLLHFLIHIDVLMLCSKFELIPTSIFQVIAKLIINIILLIYTCTCMLRMIIILSGFQLRVASLSNK